MEVRVNIEARIERDENAQITALRRRYRELKQLGWERVDFQGLHPDVRVAKIARSGGIERSEIIEMLEEGDCMSSWNRSIVEGHRDRYLQALFDRV